MEFIKAKDNKRIKKLRALIEKASERKKNSTFVVEGLKMVNEALRYDLVETLYLSESLFQSIDTNVFSGSLKEESRKLKQKINESSDFFVLSDSLFKGISETVHPQGALAVVRMPSHQLLPLIEAGDKGRIKLLILEDISDPGNLGTMVRTAEAAGMTALIMSAKTVDIYNPKVVRATMGSIFRLPFFYENNLKEVLLHLKKKGIHLYATHLNAEKSFKEMNYAGHSGILIGNEARGLSDELTELSDEYIKIPMYGEVESLNASIAAALMMYELM